MISWRRSGECLRVVLGSPSRAGSPTRLAPTTCATGTDRAGPLRAQGRSRASRPSAARGREGRAPWLTGTTGLAALRVTATIVLLAATGLLWVDAIGVAMFGRRPLEPERGPRRVAGGSSPVGPRPDHRRHRSSSLRTTVAARQRHHRQHGSTPRPASLVWHRRSRRRAAGSARTSNHRHCREWPPPSELNARIPNGSAAPDGVNWRRSPGSTERSWATTGAPEIEGSPVVGPAVMGVLAGVAGSTAWRTRRG